MDMSAIGLMFGFSGRGICSSLTTQCIVGEISAVFISWTVMGFRRWGTVL